MTMLSLPKQPEVYRPTPGEWLAAVQQDATPKKAGAVVQDESDDYWEDWMQRCDRLMVAMVPTPPPAGRLAHYENKPVQELPPVPPLVMADEKGQPQLVEQPQPLPTGSWSGQKIDFPQDYHDDMADWIQLAPVSPRRDQVLREIAGIEMMMTAEQGFQEPPQLQLPPPTSGVPGELPAVPWQGQQGVAA